MNLTPRCSVRFQDWTPQHDDRRACCVCSARKLSAAFWASMGFRKQSAGHHCHWRHDPLCMLIKSYFTPPICTCSVSSSLSGPITDRTISNDADRQTHAAALCLCTVIKDRKSDFTSIFIFHRSCSALIGYQAGCTLVTAYPLLLPWQPALHTGSLRIMTSRPFQSTPSEDSNPWLTCKYSTELLKGQFVP